MTTESNRPCCEPGACTPPAPIPAAPADHELRERVRAGYAEIARHGQWSGVRPASALATGACATPSADAAAAADAAGGGCCGPVTLSPEQVAAAVGYAARDLAALPEGANLGLSCGNPTALAQLAPGEVVLDLGSGGGLDCFLAGPRVGATGRAIGVDMTPEMLARARQNLTKYRERSGLDNVEFRLGEIEHLPVADAAVDVVLSNCVLNLSPDKPQVWREIHRVLKPGGRVAVSDLALLQPLPAGVRGDLEALVGCIAGAALVDEVRSWIVAAGLVDVTLTAKPDYVRAMTDWADPLYQRVAAALPAGQTVADYVVSLDISARRPVR
jgi:arsenite methyltransferase